jgi:hypothetical protein
MKKYGVHKSSRLAKIKFPYQGKTFETLNEAASFAEELNEKNPVRFEVFEISYEEYPDGSLKRITIPIKDVYQLVFSDLISHGFVIKTQPEVYGSYLSNQPNLLDKITLHFL